MLYKPRGIFVNSGLNFYVADCGNNRIQFFQSGQLNGTTVTINGLNGIFTLSCPTEVVLDIDGYLFIADSENNRILGSGPTGFRCIVGCTGTTGLAADQLNSPHSLSFDSYGNLFVIEYGNNRLQKFFLSSNSCGKFDR
jgi:DNA-binding beta-propeller fold protein YncE